MIKSLVELHNRIFGGLHGIRHDILGGLGRFVFASALALFFWKSAGTKLDGLFSPSFGAYYQIFPIRANAGADFGFFDNLLIVAATYGEYLLPLLIIIGLFTRLASFGMLIFIAVMSWVDIYGHNVDGGAMFDRFADGLIADQRLFWTFLLITLILIGPGRISVDRLIGIK